MADSIEQFTGELRINTLSRSSGWMTPGRRDCLVLFAGQSNMVGHRKATGGRKPRNPEVLVWSNGLAEGAWGPATLGKPPFNTAPGQPNNIALHFADRLQRVTGRRVYLIGRPVNGSTLLSWSAADAENMAAFLAEVEAALESATFAGAPPKTADFILWSQGESDDEAAKMVAAPKVATLGAYASAFGSMANCLQGQRWFSEAGTTFLASELCDDGWLSARNDFYRAPELWPRGLRMIVTSSAGLGHVGDRAHYDGEALQEIGKRMFEAALTEGLIR